MELISMHAHTGFTNHGTGSVEGLVSAARAAHLSTLALTEHYPLPAELDPTDYLAMRAEDLKGYCEEVRSAQERYGDIEILLGCELDWLGADESRCLDADAFAAFDIVLGSVHFVDAWPFDDPAQRGRWEEWGVDSVWERYVERWCQAAASPLPFTVMSHPDLVKKFGFYPGFDLGPLYARMADAAAGAKRMVEVNTSGAYYACAEMFPSPGLLAAFCRAGVACTVGTDAHRPEHVARDIGRAYEAMRRAGYREVSVPCRGGGVRTIPLY